MLVGVWEGQVGWEGSWGRAVGWISIWARSTVGGMLIFGFKR